MFKNKCNLCNKDDDLFKCGNCLTMFYCSRECQKKDWKNHSINCISVNNRKKIFTCFFYKGINDITQEFISDGNNKLGLRVCEMHHSPQLKNFNQRSKAWWEFNDKFSIPHLSETPYTIFFSSDGKTLACPVQNYSDLEKGEFNGMQLGPLTFEFHRDENDQYFITRILFVE